MASNRILKPKQTKGDKSSRAAGNSAGAMELTFIETSSPGTVPQESVKNLLYGIMSSLRGDGSPDDAQVVSPSEDIPLIYRTYRLSSTLAALIDAVVVNAYTSGFSLKPCVDITSPNLPEFVKSCLQFEASGGGISDFNFDAEAPDVTDVAVLKEIDRITRRAVNESHFLEAFFSSCSDGIPYQTICELTGQDLEIIGSGYWEILRSIDGRPRKIIWVPAWSVRAKQLSKELIAYQAMTKVSKIRWREIPTARRFRSFVQVDNMDRVIARYKEFGDPRVMSRRTGRYYTSLEEMIGAKEEYNGGKVNLDDPPTAATELLAFQLPSSAVSVYGKAKWTGAYPNARGMRDLEEYNMGVVTDDVIPQIFLLVSGGKGISGRDIEAVQEQIKQNAAQGKKGLYILQAKSSATLSSSTSSTPTVQMVKTRSEQHQDALGLKYLDRSDDTLCRAFRMSRVALGDLSNMQSDLVLRARRMTETEVYEPRREAFSSTVQTLLAAMGIQLLEYKANSRTPKEPTELAEIIRILVEAGVITPDEARVQAEGVLNTGLGDIIGAWSKLPVRLLTAILQTKNQVTAAALLSDEHDIIPKLQEALGKDLVAAASAARQDATDDAGVQEALSSSEESTHAGEGDTARSGAAEGSSA